MTDAERKAAEALSILDNTVLKDAFAAIEKAAYEELLQSSRMDPSRHGLIDRINAIRELRAHLQSVITAGTQSARKAPAVA